MNPLAARSMVVVVLCIAMPAAAAAPLLDCGKNIDACLRWAVAEAATYVQECGKRFPASRTSLDAAFARWKVLTLPIPGLDEVIKPASLERIALGKRVSTYMDGVMPYEREIECSSRLAMLLSAQPRVFADSVSLPKDALEPYLK